MALRTVILWIHVLCGVIWVGASASVALAGAVLSGEPQEWRRFAKVSAPRINRLCVVAASLIPLTGIANLAFVARAYRGRLPAAFVAILCVKVALYSAMALVLWAVGRVTVPSGAVDVDDYTGPPGVRKLTAFYVTIVVLGAIALALGLWLSGT